MHEQSLWGGICCSKPPCLSILGAQGDLHVREIWWKRKAFTVKHPLGGLSGRGGLFRHSPPGGEEDKFAVAGLTPVRSALVDAPYVSEFPLVLECKIVHVAELGLHTQFVGEILDVKAEESCFDDEGQSSPSRRSVPSVGLPRTTSYYGTGRRLGRGFSEGKALPLEMRTPDHLGRRS